MIQTQRLLMFFFLIANLGAKGQVGIGPGTPASSAQLDVSSTSKGFLPPRMTTAQRDLIGTPDAGLTIYNTTSKAFECYNGTAWYSTVHYIGENYGGGLVFYVYDNGQHGLIAPATDNSTGVQWYNGTHRVTGTAGDGVNAGAANTALVIATQLADNQTGNFAAQICAAYTVTAGGLTYSDWYLPSKQELMLLILQKNLVGGFGSGGNGYWSSTEASSGYAGCQNSSTFPGSVSDCQKQSIYFVRAVRSF